MNNKENKIIKSENTHNRIQRRMTYVIPITIVTMIATNLGISFATKAAYAQDIMVYKSPTCGCCKKWVNHLENEGFNVKTKDYNDMNPIKKTFGVNSQFQSCHTAKVGKYFIEGHVSAFEIKKLLKDKPDIKGLSAPGMPMGSPGMEGHRKDKYNVLAIDKNDKAIIYSSHN